MRLNEFNRRRWLNWLAGLSDNELLFRFERIVAMCAPHHRTAYRKEFYPYQREIRRRMRLR